jgi:hypothetical protein
MIIYQDFQRILIKNKTNHPLLVFMRISKMFTLKADSNYLSQLKNDQ